MQFIVTLNFYLNFHGYLFFESFSLPFLTYNYAGLTLTNEQVRKLNVCWNNDYRKIFAMNQWESVKCVQFYCEGLDYRNVTYKIQLKFFNDACPVRAPGAVGFLLE